MHLIISTKISCKKKAQRYGRQNIPVKFYFFECTEKKKSQHVDSVQIYNLQFKIINRC